MDTRGRRKKEVPEPPRSLATSGSWIPAMLSFDFGRIVTLVALRQNSEHWNEELFAYAEHQQRRKYKHMQPASREQESGSFENARSPDLNPRSPAFFPREFPFPPRPRNWGFRGFYPFFRDCVAKNGPVILRGACAHCPSVRPQVSTSPAKTERDSACVRKTGKISVHFLLHDCLRSSHPKSKRGTGSFFVLCGVLSLDGQE